MQKYIAIRVHTALYLSVFFLALHHVFVYFANSSILKYFFDLSITEVLLVYGIASLFGIAVYLALATFKIKGTKTVTYLFTFAEMICLAAMYIGSTQGNAALYIGAFCVHHLITPYILYNLDILFESYTHVEDRGKGRGIYLTMWNVPFVTVPFILSTLSEQSLPVVYIVSFLLLFPFLFFVYSYLQEPDLTPLIKETHKLTLGQKLKNFWEDSLDRKSFITQSILHLYYGITGVLLPIYLHSYFGYDWDKIGMLLAITLLPFILFQIPFGTMEDKNHNEKNVFIWGVVITVIFTGFSLLVKPTTSYNFLLLTVFLFTSRVGCSLIEIAMEGLFYKHVNERDAFALMMFRAGRLVPYILGIVAYLIL